MKILITGGAGLLGYELVKLISSQGNYAYPFDLSNATWKNIQDLCGVNVVVGDVTDKNQISEACRGVDCVIHLAALLPPKSEVDKSVTMKVNVEGTLNILRALKSLSNVPIIFASSISTYGITAEEELPINEEHPSCAHDFYSKSKIEAERLIRDSGIHHVILRVAPIAVSDIVELPDTIPYRADQRVEFVSETNAACALFEAASNPRALGKTLNIAGGPSWQMTGAEYIRSFYNALGVDVDSVFSEEYTALDWYDTSRSRFLGYQRTNFNDFLNRLKVLGEALGLR